MGAAPADDLGDLLADAAQAQGVTGHLGRMVQQAHDGALRRIGIHPEQQVRAGQGEEVDAVRVQDGAEVQRLAEQGGGARRRDPEDLVD